jgi:hypothetical protein
LTSITSSLIAKSAQVALQSLRVTRTPSPPHTHTHPLTPHHRDGADCCPCAVAGGYCCGHQGPGPDPRALWAPHHVYRLTGWLWGGKGGAALWCVCVCVCRYMCTSGTPHTRARARLPATRGPPSLLVAPACPSVSVFVSLTLDVPSPCDLQPSPAQLAMVCTIRPSHSWTVYAGVLSTVQPCPTATPWRSCGQWTRWVPAYRWEGVCRSVCSVHPTPSRTYTTPSRPQHMHDTTFHIRNSRHNVHHLAPLGHHCHPSR